MLSHCLRSCRVVTRLQNPVFIQIIFSAPGPPAALFAGRILHTQTFSAGQVVMFRTDMMIKH